MTTTSLPSLDKINAHVWKFAGFVHPHLPTEDYLGWVQKVLAHYEIEARSIDGALTYEWAVQLWTCLCQTEQEKCNKLLVLYTQERENNGAR